MQFTLTFKTPDIIDQLNDQFNEEEMNDIKVFLKQWIKYDEYITVKFDTNTNIAKVCKNESNYLKTIVGML
jgi:hypothetical protein